MNRESNELEIHLAREFLMSEDEGDPDYGEALATLQNAVEAGKVEHALLLGDAFSRDGPNRDLAKAYFFHFLASASEALDAGEPNDKFFDQLYVGRMTRAISDATRTCLETKAMNILASTPK